jgi:hypothetical protein
LSGSPSTPSSPVADAGFKPKNVSHASGRPSVSASVSAAWTTVAVPVAIESVPERCARLPKPGPTEKRTLPAPTPLVAPVRMIHGAFEVAVHGHETRDGVTVTTPSPPIGPRFVVNGASV